MTLLEMKGIYTSVISIESRVKHLVKQFQNSKAQQYIDECSGIIWQIEELLGNQLSHILQENSLALAEHFQTLRNLCLDMGWGICYDHKGYKGSYIIFI